MRKPVVPSSFSIFLFLISTLFHSPLFAEGELSDISPGDGKISELQAYAFQPNLHNNTLVTIAGFVASFSEEKNGYYLSDGREFIKLVPTDIENLAPFAGHRVLLSGRVVISGSETRIVVHKIIRSSPTWEDNPVMGTQPLLVLLIKFSDISNTKSSSDMNDMVFTKMKSYYSEVSYRLLSFSGNTTTSWYKLSLPMSSYGSGGPSSERRRQLVLDSIAIADPEVNFRDYKYVILVHAGGDEAITRNSDDIWSFASIGPISITTADGTVSIGVAVVSEFDPLGAFAHETGHTLGLPDLYDEKNEQVFIGKWDLMAEGSYNGNPPATSPAHISSWGKMKLGWILSNEIYMWRGEEITLRIEALETRLSGTKVVKVPITSTTYYLVEAREKVGFDISLPGSGVLILLADDTIPSGEGPVRLRDASSSTKTLDDAAFQPGQRFTDQALNVQISILSKGVSSYTITVSRIIPLREAYFSSIKVTHGNGVIELIAGGKAKVHASQYPIWVNATVFNERTGASGADLYTKVIETFQGVQRTSTSASRLIPKGSSEGFTWLRERPFQVPLPVNFTIQLWWNNAGTHILEDEKLISMEVIKLGVVGWNSSAPMLFKGSIKAKVLSVSFSNGGNDVMYNVTISPYDTMGLIVSPQIQILEDVISKGTKSAIFEISAPMSVAVGNYSISFKIGYRDFRGVATEEAKLTTVTIAKMPTVLTASAEKEVKLGKSVRIEAQLLDNEGRPLPEKGIEFQLGSVLIGSSVTNTTGAARFSYPLTRAGSYLFKASYAGSADYSGSSSPSLELRGVPLNLTVSTGVPNASIVWLRPSQGYGIAQFIIHTDPKGRATFPIQEVGTYVVGVNSPYVVRDGERKVFLSWGFVSRISSPITTPTSDQIILDLREDLVLSASFKTQYLLKVNSQYGSATGEEWYDDGTVAKASVSPLSIDWGNRTRHVFTSWAGDATASNATISVKMNSPKAATALWKTQYEMSVGSLYGSPRGSGWHDKGIRANFSVASLEDHGNLTRRVFIRWQGDSTSSLPNSSLNMDRPKTVLAEWKTQYYVSVLSQYGNTRGEGWYDKNSVATFSVTSPHDHGNMTRRVFVGWRGDSNFSETLSNFTVNTPKKALAQWKTQYYLKVSSDYGYPRGDGWYDKGSEASFSVATTHDHANGTRRVFSQWTGDSTARSQASSLSIDSPKSLVANWIVQYFLMIRSDYGEPKGEGWYDKGTEASFSISTPIDHGNETRRVFAGWTGDSKALGTMASILMDSRRSPSAIWKTQYFVKVDANGGNASGGGWYDEGSEVHIKAETPTRIVEKVSRLSFTGWTGGVSSTSPNISVKANSPHTLVANWKVQYFLEVSSAEGEVDLGSQWVDGGRTVTMRAISPSKVIANKSRFVFAGWIGSASSTSNIVAITMDSNKVLGASWKTQYYLRVLTEYGEPKGEGWYDKGSRAEISVGSPIGGFIQQVFERWDGEITSRNNPVRINIDSPKTVQAIWRTDYTQLMVTIAVPVVAVAVVFLLIRTKIFTVLKA